MKAPFFFGVKTGGLQMKYVKPSVEFITKFDGMEILKTIEKCGRTCYKSEDKITDESASKFVRSIIKRGHESVLEHVNLSVKFISDRTMSHQLVRHRIAAYSQESQRYCCYAKDKFDNEIKFIKPNFSYLDDAVEKVIDKDVKEVLAKTERLYKYMISNGCKAEDARAILPNTTKTEIVATFNLRQWRHIFKVRLDKHAQRQIRWLMYEVYKMFVIVLPEVFDDIIPYTKDLVGLYEEEE